jgi:hypothetical protein
MVHASLSYSSCWVELIAYGVISLEWRRRRRRCNLDTAQEDARAREREREREDCTVEKTGLV